MDRVTSFRAAMLSTLMVAIVASTGCMGVMSQLMYVIKGTNVPASYAGLNEKRVAVVCVSDASAYGPDPLTYTISNALSVKLARGLKKSMVIPVTKIEQWIDTHGWDQRDFTQLGKGVEADVVVAVDVSSYTIHEGSTMFKGKSDVTVTVYDVEKEGEIDFHYGPKFYEFPKTGRPAIQTTDREFEAMYLGQLVIHLANQFVDHDKMDAFAADAIMN